MLIAAINVSFCGTLGSASRDASFYQRKALTSGRDQARTSPHCEKKSRNSSSLALHRTLPTWIRISLLLRKLIPRPAVEQTATRFRIEPTPLLEEKCHVRGDAFIPDMPHQIDTPCYRPPAVPVGRAGARLSQPRRVRIAASRICSPDSPPQITQWTPSRFR